MKAVLIFPERCIGCKHCELSCAIAHSQTKSLFSMFSEKIISKPRIHVEVGEDLLTFPNKCRHCNPAPCIEICPTNAIVRDESTEFVLVEYSKCITCGMCAIACPFGIITFDKTPNVMTNRSVNLKCDNCIERVEEGKEPACVEACKTNALVFGEINNLIGKKRKNITKTVTKSPDEAEEFELPENIKLWRSMLKHEAHSNKN
ncbi:4Fe-4S dicluster domain-containing protein [Deferribacter autotrophicus]|uniref:4Fe-4S dicluster domain-containing protein n=1 Tax=Deferribacter autotrophicus TaxID=500465 RepID=A0A5A8EZC7_9BACT|nr:4Fe-4S dicluster domain-containing protein [Deferribacter autotrophicus]KAA0256843.1 4Fe-4S dicluster domain-containing protein [Deferribacter autotrophicus]